VAIGDLVTDYGAYEFNGFKFGHNTNFMVTQFTGLYDKADIKTTDYARKDAWGEYPGRDLYKGKALVATIDIVNEAGTIDTDVDALRAAWAIPERIGIAAPVPLVFWRNWPYAGKRFIMCRPGRLSLPSDFDLAYGHGTALCELKANDPRIYSLAPTTVALPGSVVNHGDSAAAPVVTIVGPTSGWAAVLNASDDNRLFVLDRALTGAETLVVDFGKRTVLINGSDARQLRDVTSQWWKLQPGTNVITLPDPAASASLTFNHTWS